MATTVTVKGQVTLPKAVREAAEIRPGDRVNVRARAEGGVIIESVEPSDANEEEYLRRLEDMSRRRPFEGFTTEEVMAMTRSEV
jgi:AbrB family looped-hinge helix DNA binding protein